MNISSLGMIAGNRSLPLLFAREARRQGINRLVAVAFENESDPGLVNLVDKVIWLKVGQLSKLIAAFKGNGIGQCVMLGQVAPRNLFDVRPDLRALGLLLKLKERNAHTIFGALAEELKREGIELIEPLPWLQPHMAPPGFHLGPALCEEQRADVEFGYRIAKEIARLEVGQIAVVKKGTVLAVEAFEGTDRCLARGGELAGNSGDAVAVKVAKAKHDMRFDIPCIGAQTLKSCIHANIGVLAVEAGKTLVLESEEIRKLAEKEGISIVSVVG